MRKIFIPLIIGSIAFGLASCNPDKKNDHESSEAQGGVYLGGVMRMNEVEAFKSLNPIAVNEQVCFHLGTQLFEGLVKFDQNDLSVKPAIAYKWESNDQVEWTFHIRKGVKFHDDPCFKDGKGRDVNANDVKFCFDKLCTADPNNAQYDVTFKDRVVGANEAFAASKAGKGSNNVTGIKVINDSTISIILSNADAGFLNILAMPGCWIYPKEALNKYGLDMRVHPVGSGPFQLETIKEGEVVIMKKNPNYYGVDGNGNKLPYLDGLKYTFIREKKSEILEFKSGNLDMVYRLPVEVFHEIMGDLEHAKDRKTDFAILNSTAFNTNFIGFNCTSNAFNKKEVRLAFNYAIDRNKIADFTIQGEGTAANYGMVPYVEAFEKDGYNYKGLKAYSFDPQKAKDYLKQAGYADGKGFPKVTLEINSGGGDRNILIAEVVQKMLKENLNIDIDINTVPQTEHIEQVTSGKSDMFRLAWFADYPDPETFLTIFYGKHIPANPAEKSYINFCRFKNAKFDSLFASSFKEPNKTKRFAILSQAEQVVLDEAPLMPIFYDENYRLEQLNVRNFPENALNYMDLTTVYMIPKDKMPKK